MAKLEDVVSKQKDGAKFVISAQMLGMDMDEFEIVAKTWCEHGGPGVFRGWRAASGVCGRPIRHHQDYGDENANVAILISILVTSHRQFPLSESSRMKPNQYLRTIVLSACFVAAGHAAAHAHPKTEVPADGATVSAPPEVSIVFDDPLEPAFSSITVNDAQGHPVTTAKAELDAVTHKNLHVSLPTLAPGAYQVKWVAVSVDGHRTNGAYRFMVK